MDPPSVVLLADRYRLGEPLGTGGMATVYDAVDERLQRRVAVKVLRPELAGRADVRARFESEARSAAQLTHPNVVGVFDTGEATDGTPFLVMERLPGETLADRMQAEGGVDADWLMRVAGDVLGALGAAHAAGIVHRDVKPGNILIAADGCAKVGDFGIAKSLEVAAAADLTSTNQLVGTPAYVAPERISGRAATVQSDLYALGVALYEGLAGHKPFSVGTPVATAYAIQHETPPPLASLRPDLAPSVVAAVERAMDRSPERRFASAEEMAAALGVGLAGVAPTAGAVAARDDATVLAAAGPGGLGLAAGAAAAGMTAAGAAAGSTQVLPVVDAVPAQPAGSTGRRLLPAGWPRFHDPRRLALVAAAGIVVALLLIALLASAGGDGDDPSDPSGSPRTTTTAAPATTTTTPPTTAPAVVADEGGGEEEDEGRGRTKGKRGGDDD